MSKFIEMRHLRHTRPHHIHLLTQEDVQFYCAALPSSMVGRHDFQTLGTVSHMGSHMGLAHTAPSQTLTGPLRIVMTTRASYQKI